MVSKAADQSNSISKDGAVTYLTKSFVYLTKCNSKVIVDYYYFIKNYNYFQNEIHHYYYDYCEKCNRYYYNYPRSGIWSNKL